MKSSQKTSTTTKQAPSTGRRTDATNANEVAAISRTLSRYKSDPKALRQAMQKAGILTESGKLTKEYRSQCFKIVITRFFPDCFQGADSLFDDDTPLETYQTVRGAFWEGDELYPNAGFKEKNHVQLVIRDMSCIKGYFLPIGF